MISVISSIEVTQRSERPFPGLQSLCYKLRDRGFRAVDVIIAESDIRAALSLVKSGSPLDEVHKQKGTLKTLGQLLAGEIAEAVTSNESVSLIVPAFATNFPNISNTSDDQDHLTGECLWQVAINNLATSLIAANILGVQVVEIVCGRRVLIEFTGDEGLVSDLEDQDTVKKIESRFVDGVWHAFERSYRELEEFPQVAIGLELEPDILALAKDLQCTNMLRKALVRGPTGTAILNGYREEIRNHFGINLDWCHLLVTLDREKPDEFVNAKIKTQRLLEQIGPYVVHAHVGDHARGAHWIDAPLGSCRPLSDFEFLFKYYSGLIETLEQNKKEETNHGLWEFATGSVAIELEARGDVGLAVKSRDQLNQLAIDCGCSLQSEKDQRIEIEHCVALLPPSIARKGWFEGINSAIFYSLNKLLNRSQKPPAGCTTLLDNGLLELIRDFLICRKAEVRTRLAVKIVEETLGRGKVGALSSWVKYLLNQEWLGVFYPAYRDHTVHVVYVYLLGWFLYTECPQIRRMIQGNEDLQLPVLDWDFAREWMITALSHDIGYPLESDKPNVRINTIQKLNTYHQDFISWAILSKGDPRSDDYVFFKSESDAIVLDLKGGPIPDKFHVPQKGDLTNKKEGEEHDLKKIDVVEKSHVFDVISAESEEKLKLGRGGLKEIFNFLRSTEPRGSLVASGGRPAFLDHGIVSAAILNAVKEAHDEWANEIKKRGGQIRENVRAGVSPEVIKRVLEWPESYDSALWAHDKQSFDHILTAITAHNIYPEPAGSVGGNLHRAADVSRGCPILRFFQITQETPLALLLAMCDALQDWHRQSFSNPLTVDSETIDALEVRVFVDPRTHRVRFLYPDNENMKKRKIKEFNARFGDIWTEFIEFGAPEA